MVKNIIVGVLICFLWDSNYCQDFNFSQITLKKWVDSDTLIIDSNSINPRTFQVLDKYEKNYTSYYKLDAAKGEVVFKNPPRDTLIFKFHPLLLNFRRNYLIHPLILNRKKSENQLYNPITISSDKNSNNLFKGTMTHPDLHKITLIVPFLLYFLLLVALLFLYFNTKSIHVFSKLRFIKKWIGDIKSINNIKFSIKLCALGFALLRYLVFYFQYLILAKAIHLELDYLSLFTYVGVLFGVVTFIPSPLPGNLGTREGVASFLLGGGIFGIKFSLISFIVWLINVGFSTIFGGIVYSYSYLRK